jgi:hypothetical protein
MRVSICAEVYISIRPETAAAQRFLGPFEKTSFDHKARSVIKTNFQNSFGNRCKMEVSSMFYEKQLLIT